MPFPRSTRAGRVLRRLSIAVTLLLASCVHSGIAVAQVDQRDIRRAIGRGVDYLKTVLETIHGAETGLVAYALVTAEVTPDTPVVAKALEQLQAKVNDKGEYKPAGHHIYEAGVDAMALEAADAKLYRTELEAIAKYLIAEQRTNGQWDYPHQNNGGDTSITQYGALGLWAAARAGVPVPVKAWDCLGSWLLKTQLKNGASAYWPVGGRAEPTHSMSAAGTGSLLITRLHLGGDETFSFGSQKKRGNGQPFGVLEMVDEEEENASEKGAGRQRRQREEEDYVPKLQPKSVDPGITRGLGWLGANFNLKNPVGAPIYYLYGMERVGALAHVEKMGAHDWYAEGATYLLKKQEKDGSWNANWHVTISTAADTSFAILFLSKSTAKHIKPSGPPPIGVGTGLLSGGRGLPDDLSQAEASDGTIREKKVDTPLDKLLSDLANPETLNVESAQTQLVQNIQVGNREELIGQKDLLLKLVNDPRMEVRRTAVWALGRCEDLRLGRVLVEALKDPDLDIVVEARNALCALSRRPLGFGLPDAPVGQNDGSPDKAAIQKWRSEAYKRWQAWYLSVRPYEERDDLPVTRP